MAMKFNDIITEAKRPEEKAAKLWLKISNLLVDLEDELREIAKYNQYGRQALTDLDNDDLRSLHRSIRALLNHRK